MASYVEVLNPLILEMIFSDIRFLGDFDNFNCSEQNFI